MAAPAPLPSFTETVKKVDRAVAKLEQLQSSFRSRNRTADRQRPPQERSSVRHKLDFHVLETKPSRRHSLLAPPAKDAKKTQSERELHRRGSLPVGLANKRVPEIVEALTRKGTVSDKENLAAKKKRKKKSALPAPVEPAPVIVRGHSHRRVLESRPINVVATELGLPSPLSSGSDTKSCKENKQTKASDNPRSNGDGRPPWKNVTIISTNNRHAATIAERVRPNSATTGAHHATTGVRKSTTGAECSELMGNRKVQNRGSLPVSGHTSKAGAPSARAPSAQEDIDFVKAFCVDVRPDPNRPWRLAPKMSNTARPLVMFPNPAFRADADQRTIDDRGIPLYKPQQASPKITPFKSFQLRPLKLSSLQHQPLFEPSPATIRPYLSPSKTSPRQSKPHEEEDALAFLIGSRAPHGLSSSPLNSNRGSSLKKPTKEVPLQKGSWLSNRLSLPCSPSSKSFLKRFSLLHSSKHSDNTNSPVKPLPSLITRLPTRTKPTSIDSLIITPPPCLAKSLSNSTSATPLVSPLPLPPALRAVPSKAHSSHKHEVSLRKRSSSCNLHPERDSHSKGQRDNYSHRSLSSRGLRETLESTRKKPLPSGFGTSMWPSMKHNSSSCQPHSLGCTSNCTGAGPYLIKHVKGWMLNKKALGSQGHKDSFTGR